MIFKIKDVVVEWDDKKNIINRKKHGISFEEAARIATKKEEASYYGNSKNSR